MLCNKRHFVNALKTVSGGGKLAIQTFLAFTPVDVPGRNTSLGCIYVKLKSTSSQCNASKVSIKEVRDKLNLTQGDLAKLLKTKQQNVSAMERGARVPEWLEKAITLHRLLSKAGYTLDDLILSLPDPEDRVS